MNRKQRRAQATKDRRAAWKAHQAETWTEKRDRIAAGRRDGMSTTPFTDAFLRDTFPPSRLRSLERQVELVDAAGHFAMVRLGMLPYGPIQDTRPLASETDVWDSLGIPYQMPDGQWRAAFAHGHSVLLTDDERDELRRRHGVSE